MGIMDKIKNTLGTHGDKVEKGVDKAADMINEKTGGKYTDKIDTAAEKAKEQVEKQRGDQR